MTSLVSVDPHHKGKTSTAALTDLLSRLSAPILKGYCRALNILKGASLKIDFVRCLAGQIEHDLAPILKEMSHEERTLLAEIAYHSGPYEFAEFQAKYPRWQPEYPPETWSKKAGFVWMFCTMDGDRYVMNPDVAKRVRALVAKPVPPVLMTVEDVPAEISGKRLGPRPVNIHRGNDISLIELRRVLSLAKAGKIKVLAPANRPAKGGEWDVADVLVGADFDLAAPNGGDQKGISADSPGLVRAHAWPVLAQQCGWCEVKANTLTLTRRGEEMLSRGDVYDFRKGVHRFIENDQFDELNRIDRIPGQMGYAKRNLTRPSERRRPIYEHMKSWPPGKWIEFIDAYRFLKASGTGFETSTQPISSFLWYIQGPAPGSVTEHINRLYFRAFLFESLGTLGLIDLAYVHPHELWPEISMRSVNNRISFFSRYDGLLYVRLNKLGAYCLGLTEEYDHRLPELKGLVRVLPNHEIVVPDPKALPPVAAYALDAVAKQSNDSVWTIDKKKILELLEKNGRLKEMLDLLDDFSSDGIPDNVRLFLEEVGRKAGSVLGSEETLLIELTDGQAAAEIARHSRTSKFCKLAHDRFVVIGKNHERSFRTALKKLGYVLPL